MTYVVVLSYHSVADIRRCVESLLTTDYPADRWRIVVVDNDSEPETRELLASYGDRIDVVIRETNTGYAGGMNIGIRHALERGAEHVVLMNQDTEIDPAWLRHLVAAAESDPSIGAVQPRIMLGQKEDGDTKNSFSPSRREGEREGEGANDLVNSIGNHIHILGFGFAGGYRERWSDLRQQLRGYPYPEVTYPSGAAVLYRAAALRDVAFPRGEHTNATNADANASNKQSTFSQRLLQMHSQHSHEIRNIRMFDRLQFLDEDYFLYHEDLDIGVRLWLRGWRCVLAPQSVVTHHYEFSRSITKLYWMERNRILFLIQNFRLPTLLLLAPALILSELGLLVIAKRSGWLAQKLKAWRSILNPRNWATYRRHRREKQSKRRHSDRAVLCRFVTRLTNQEMPNRLVERIVDPCLTAWWRCVRSVIWW